MFYNFLVQLTKTINTESHRQYKLNRVNVNLLNVRVLYYGILYYSYSSLQFKIVQFFSCVGSTLHCATDCRSHPVS